MVNSNSGARIHQLLRGIKLFATASLATKLDYARAERNEEETKEALLERTHLVVDLFSSHEPELTREFILGEVCVLEPARVQLGSIRDWLTKIWSWVEKVREAVRGLPEVQHVLGRHVRSRGGIGAEPRNAHRSPCRSTIAMILHKGALPQRRLQRELAQESGNRTSVQSGWKTLM
jgi:hypothetical protein